MYMHIKLTYLWGLAFVPAGTRKGRRKSASNERKGGISKSYRTRLWVRRGLYSAVGSGFWWGQQNPADHIRAGSPALD